MSKSPKKNLPSNSQAPTGRKATAQGNEPASAGAAALGPPPPQNPSPEGAGQKLEWIPIGDLVTDKIDRTGPAGSDDFIYIDIGSVDRDSKLIVDPKMLPVEKAPSRAKQVLKSGDVLVSMTRPNLNAVAIVTPKLDGAIGSTGFHVLRANHAEPSFLFYAVQTQAFIEAMCQKVQGALYPAVRPNDISSFLLPLFPLNEQKRIVSKIEELFSELDAGEESLRRARRQLGVYRQSLLKQAFEGKLTAPWRQQNPHRLEFPDQLLASVQAERQARYEQKLNDWETNYDAWENGGAGDKRPVKPRKPKSIHLPNTKQVNHLPNLPPEWSWIAIENCAVEISDGPFGSNLKSSDYVGSGVRVVRLENIGAGEFIEAKESFISLEKYEVLKRHTVRPGDIVVASFINDAVRAALIPPSIAYAVNKADCFQVHCFGESFSAEFLLRCLGSRYFFKQLEQLVHGVGRPRINTTQLGEAFIPHCSIPEQQEIVRLLDEQFTVVEQNEREIDAALKRSTALRQSILKKAFTGQLVPQDPTDEPASTLLKRVQKERENSKEGAMP